MHRGIAIKLGGRGLQDPRLQPLGEAHQFEPLMRQEMLDIAPRAGEENIDAQNFRALSQQPFAQMRAEEAGAAGDQHALRQMTPKLPASIRQ